MITIKLTLDKRYKRKDGLSPIRIGVSNQKYFYVSTGVFVDPKHFDGYTITRGDRHNKAKNAKLTMLLDRANSVVMDVERKGSPVSDKQLRQKIDDAIAGRRQQEYTLLDAIDSYIENKTSIQTLQLYNYSRQRVEAYDKGVMLKDINHNWLTGFNNFMLDSGLSINSAALYMRTIRAVINHALDNEWMEAYPFRRFKIKTQETPKRTLSIRQIQMIRDADLRKGLQLPRDMFMLTFYLCGINMVDLSRLTGITVDGRIEYYRSKTGKLYSINVEPEAMRIISKYRGTDLLLNVLDGYADYVSLNGRINLALKSIVKSLGGEKKGWSERISLYWARHSWATIASSIDIPDDVISQALGHSPTNTTTAIYIDRSLRKVDEANRKVIDAIKRG